jgi:uncharacterized membrane protein YccC
MPSNDPAANRGRTILGAIEAGVGTALAIGGGLVVWLAPGITIDGMVPLVLGVLGVMHGIAVRLGAIRVPPGGCTSVAACPMGRAGRDGPRCDPVRAPLVGFRGRR